MCSDIPTEIVEWTAALLAPIIALVMLAFGVMLIRVSWDAFKS